MRPILFLLLSSSLLLAEDEFENVVRVFEQARTQTSAPGAQAQVLPAVERLAATGDVRAVPLLAGFLVETFAREQEALKLMREVQKEGALALEQVEELGKEIQHLGMKQRAGDTSVGPRLQKLTEERRKADMAFEEARRRSERLDRLVQFLHELRGTLAGRAAGLLAGLDGERIEAGLKQLRASFDLTQRDQALFLVRILRACERPEAEAHLLGVLAHPKIERPVLVAALQAVARFKTRAGADALIQLAQREPDLLPDVLHALGLAAGQRLQDLEAARAWADTLS